MHDLIDFIGSAVLIIGLAIHFSLGFAYGLWRPYFKKIRLSKQEFAKVIRLMGVPAFVAGSGMTIIILANLQSTSWVSRIVPVALCAVIYPVLQTGVFIFHMRREGHVQRIEHEKPRKNDKV